MHTLHIIHPPLSSQFLLVAGILHDIRPHQNCTSTRMCQEREKNVRDSGYGFQPGSPRTWHPISAPVVAPGPKLSTTGPTSLSVRALPIRRLDPTSVVDHPPRLLRLHACSVVLERPCPSLLLSPRRQPLRCALTSIFPFSLGLTLPRWSNYLSLQTRHGVPFP